MQSTYGRSRNSIADIEHELHTIFASHADAHTNDAGEPVIPGNALVDVFRTFGEQHDGLQLMTAEEEAQMLGILASNPGIEVTPAVLLGFIAMRTTGSGSPQKEAHDGDGDGDAGDLHAHEEDARARGRGERDEDGRRLPHSRSSSHSSSASQGSRGNQPQVPHTPVSATSGRIPDSPFDNGRRQRSTPLVNAAPSSWNARRPPPAHRRKSDAGAPGMPKRALSDSESTPAGHSRRSSRSRAPSNPTSPHGISAPQELQWSVSSPPYIGSPPMHSGSFSRPHSRAQSHGQFSMNAPLPGFHYDAHDASALRSPGSDHDDSFEYMRRGDRADLAALSLPARRQGSDSDSDHDHSDDEDDPTLGLVHDRELSTKSSTTSLAPHDRLDALTRANTELGRKLLEAERTLQKKLSEHEGDLEDMQQLLEEAKSELSSTKREEKELRAKERQNSVQISALESEIAVLQKNLDNAKASYQSLQKQYQEQCAESEKYRNTLRRRDQEIKDHREQISLHAMEINKWQQARDQSEVHLANLEAQLNIAREAQVQLDEQKQENLLLKETIDRMRFDMDELRTKADGLAGGGAAGSGGASAQSSISKSLGLEIMRMNNGRWMGEEEEEEEEDDGDTAVGEEIDGEDTEGEDVIQTIITRKKRKVAGRANRTETIHVEDIKEYSDAYTQHEVSEFTSSQTAQTDPTPIRPTASFSIQTDEPTITSSSIQTEPEVVPSPLATREMEIQTENPEPSRPSTPDEELASSSSTLRPPTPKPAESPSKGELPPSYSQVTRLGKGRADDLDNEQQDAEERELAALRRWHKELHVPLQALRGGVSDDAREEWAALKEELGIGCLAIDRVLAMTPRAPATPARRARRLGQFFNIYNTVVLRGDEDNSALAGSAGGGAGGLLQTFVLALGISVVGFAVMAPYTSQPHYAVPGGVSYYDRAAWASFNSMSGNEGFAPDGTAAVWNFIGRVGGGAARMARGWPS